MLAEWLEFRSLQPREPMQNLYYTHPFSHRPLVEFCLTIPVDVACGPGEPRRLMRRAFEGLWPPKLRTRRSKGLFSAECFDGLRPLARKLLQDTKRLQVVERGLVNRESFMKRLNRLVQSFECNEPQLRRVILLEFWLRRYEKLLPLEMLARTG